jgi:hypothetical protein
MSLSPLQLLLVSFFRLCSPTGGSQIEDDSDTFEEYGIDDGARICVQWAEGIECSYQSDFDENGVIFYLGTGCGKETEFKNPNGTLAIVEVHTSVGWGEIGDFLSRDPTLYHRTGEGYDNWMAVTFTQHELMANKYTLRNTRDDDMDSYVLRNWKLQGRNDPSEEWVDIKVHENDDRLVAKAYSTASWDLDADRAYRSFRVLECHTQGGSHYLHAAIELYGTLIQVESNL